MKRKSVGRTDRPARTAAKKSAPAAGKPSSARGPVRIGPSKEVVRLSEDLEKLLQAEQLRQKAPRGMEKCPLCGAIIEPTRTRRVRTHDNPVKGMRCEASKGPKGA